MTKKKKTQNAHEIRKIRMKPCAETQLYSMMVYQKLEAVPESNACIWKIALTAKLLCYKWRYIYTLYIYREFWHVVYIQWHGILRFSCVLCVYEENEK